MKQMSVFCENFNQVEYYKNIYLENCEALFSNVRKYSKTPQLPVLYYVISNKRNYSFKQNIQNYSNHNLCIFIGFCACAPTVL